VVSSFMTVSVSAPSDAGRQARVACNATEVTAISTAERMGGRDMETISVQIDTSAGGRLRAELKRILQRLQRDEDVPHFDFVTGDFLDVAQGVEQQELAHLSVSRLTERARRLCNALTRLEDGEYGVCSECGAPIPPKRLLALPDTTTCVACQEQLERVGPR